MQCWDRDEALLTSVMPMDPKAFPEETALMWVPPSTVIEKFLEQMEQEKAKKVTEVREQTRNYHKQLHSRRPKARL